MVACGAAKGQATLRARYEVRFRIVWPEVLEGKGSARRDSIQRSLLEKREEEAPRREIPNARQENTRPAGVGAITRERGNL